MKTRAEEKPGDAPLPQSTRTETVLQRDEWMLLPPSASNVAGSSTQSVPVDEDMMDGFGETSTNARTMSGSVDFFSSLGSERKKKPQADKPNPDKVSTN